jgi:outer membrane protein assembly factor BamB
VLYSPKTLLTAAFVASLMLTNTLWAEDWPQWRGPNRDGLWSETGVLETFPRDGLKIRWRAAVGPGWSSPVVAQGRVYLTDSHLRRPKAEERVLCFDETNGNPLWTHVYEVTYPDWAFTAEQNGCPCATPLVKDGKVYAVGGSGQVFCLDARTGKQSWEKRLEKEYEVAVLSCRPSPLLEGNLLIVCIGGKPGACVLALDKDSGKEIWKALDDPVSNSSPIIVQAGGKRQLIVWTGESVTSLDPATGKVYWREQMVTSNNDAIPTPVFQKNKLLISGLMYQLDSDKPVATILWPASKAPARRLLSNTSTPVLQGDHVYSARSSGQLVCLEAGTGKEIWKDDQVTDLKNGASIHLTPNGDAMFLYTDRGELIRAKLTPQGYREISRARLVEPVYAFGGRKVAWSPPAYANRHVFTRTEKELVCASLAARP